MPRGTFCSGNPLEHVVDLSDKWFLFPQRAFVVIVTLRNAFPKHAMEMTEFGKHGKPRSRLSTLPTLLGNPFGITTFPRPRLLAYFKVQKHERPNPRQLDLKGVVTQVLGPKCNERSSTLTPLRKFWPLLLGLAFLVQSGSKEAWPVHWVPQGLASETWGSTSVRLP
jgi:hypothetical protein